MFPYLRFLVLGLISGFMGVTSYGESFGVAKNTNYGYGLAPGVVNSEVEAEEKIREFCSPDIKEKPYSHL
jgi:hypothetical protein